MRQVAPDPRPYAQFILDHLLKRLPGAYSVGRAVSETEVPIDRDDWYWADDNAKVLALLGLPEMWQAYREEVSDIVRFVISMCDGPLIFRRIATPRLDVLQCNAGVGSFHHSLMNVTCDLNNGTVSLGMRFHDGRTAKNATLSDTLISPVAVLPSRNWNFLRIFLEVASRCACSAVQGAPRPLRMWKSRSWPDGPVKPNRPETKTFSKTAAASSFLQLVIGEAQTRSDKRPRLFLPLDLSGMRKRRSAYRSGIQDSQFPGLDDRRNAEADERHAAPCQDRNVSARHRSPMGVDPERLVKIPIAIDKQHCAAQLGWADSAVANLHFSGSVAAYQGQSRERQIGNECNAADIETHEWRRSEERRVG